ncbi:MAG: hypothetical protein JRI79_07615 [Deltaproteobacteria bacterium]|nr:hypothetical protein [Deltaproteobacteria bacterium]MBW2301063.1 hypothetical protein [Deltaproteobacteria bacterium]
MEYIEMHQDPSEDKEKDLQKKLKRASEEIRQAVNIGSFFISQEAEMAMLSLWDEMEKTKNEPSFYEYLSAKVRCVNKALRKIKTQAKKDLGVK